MPPPACPVTPHPPCVPPQETEIAPVIAGYWERAEFPFPLVPGFQVGGRGRGLWELLERHRRHRAPPSRGVQSSPCAHACAPCRPTPQKLGIGGGSLTGYGCQGLSVVGAAMAAVELVRAEGGGGGRAGGCSWHRRGLGHRSWPDGTSPAPATAAPAPCRPGWTAPAPLSSWSTPSWPPSPVCDARALRGLAGPDTCIAGLHKRLRLRDPGTHDRHHATCPCPCRSGAAGQPGAEAGASARHGQLQVRAGRAVLCTVLPPLAAPAPLLHCLLPARLRPVPPSAAAPHPHPPALPPAPAPPPQESGVLGAHRAVQRQRRVGPHHHRAPRGGRLGAQRPQGGQGG